MGGRGRETGREDIHIASVQALLAIVTVLSVSPFC